MTPEDLSDEEVLSLTIIGEARGEPIEGQVAVGCITRNRLHNRHMKSYSNVCLEARQFSCWNQSDPNRAFLMDLAQRMITAAEINDPYLRQCMLVAHGIIDWSIIDNTKGSEFYITTKLFNSGLRPKWAAIPAQDPIVKGSHTFFMV